MVTDIFCNQWGLKHCLFLLLLLPVSRSKISLGSKALSHDSVFVSDSSEANEALGASQDSIHGKVKSLQVNVTKIYSLKDGVVTFDLPAKTRAQE